MWLAFVYKSNLTTIRSKQKCHLICNPKKPSSNLWKKILESERCFFFKKLHAALEIQRQRKFIVLHCFSYNLFIKIAFIFFFFILKLFFIYFSRNWMRKKGRDGGNWLHVMGIVWLKSVLRTWSHISRRREFSCSMI